MVAIVWNGQPRIGSSVVCLVVSLLVKELVEKNCEKVLVEVVDCGKVCRARSWKIAFGVFVRGSKLPKEAIVLTPWRESEVRCASLRPAESTIQPPVCTHIAMIESVDSSRPPHGRLLSSEPMLVPLFGFLVGSGPGSSQTHN